MKKMLPLAATCLLMVGCGQTENKETTKEPVTMEAASASTLAEYPYKPRYSVDFKLGETKYAQIIMELWKQYDDNNLQAAIDKFADSVTLHFSDGTVLSNTRDSVMAMTVAHRQQYAKVHSELDVVFPMTENKTGEQWVCVWGEEFTEMKNGKKDSTLLHEVWQFDKNGKIVFMHQYAGKD